MGLRSDVMEKSEELAAARNAIVDNPDRAIILSRDTNTLDQGNGGERGIRTLGKSLQTYGGLANRCLQPLGHLSR